MADSKSIAVLNLGSQRLSGAVFSKVGGDLVLKKYEFVDMTGDPTVDASRIPQMKVGLQELASRLKLKGQQVFYAVAGHTVFSRFVKLPPVQADRVAQIVEFEAKQNVPFPINEVTWDYEIVSDGGGETEVILVAMKSDSLNEINDQVAHAALKTKLVDLAPLALYNAFRYSYPDVQEPSVIIDLGARSTNMVFVEDGRFFVRNVLVGGASITSAIAKEFGLGFGEAEQQKLIHGFVAQGGAVMEHEDPEIAALSKVIRNAATRLHGEVMRTINFYRSQQGGSQPARVFICGGGALLGNMALFLEEKLKIPVEIFNPLRGVQVDRSVNADAASADAPFMGELVGLALRAGSSPSEIELVPDVVANARDAARRAPALVMAGLCLWAALGAGIYYYQGTTRATQEQLAQMQQENARLTGLANQIRDLDNQLTQSIAQSQPLIQAVGDRSYWVRLLTEMNSKFDTDLIWLTSVELLKDGKSITPALFGQEQSSSSSRATPKAGQQPVYELQVQGLYRKNDQGEQIVYRYAGALAKSGWFDAENYEAKRAEFVSAESGVEEDRYAYKFNIKLPLKQPMKF